MFILLSDLHLLSTPFNLSIADLHMINLPSADLLIYKRFTPLKIYNGTAKAVPLEIQGQQLPINELNGDASKEACPISNLHRFKIGARA